MSAEAAALRLGSTAARSAAQAWLGGKRREQERRLSMAELVRLRVPGLRLQRSVERQFEEIADAVFDRLAPFLEREFRGMDWSGCRTGRCSRPRAPTGTGSSGDGTWSW
ncbi:hypothetical protein SALBM311S_03369 [Streptomyces alboniger]